MQIYEVAKFNPAGYNADILLIKRGAGASRDTSANPDAITFIRAGYTNMGIDNKSNTGVRHEKI